MEVVLSITGAAAARMAAPSLITSMGVTFTFFTFFLLKPVRDRSSSSEFDSSTKISSFPASTVGRTRNGANASAASFESGCIFGSPSFSPSSSLSSSPTPPSSSFTAFSVSTFTLATATVSSTPGAVTLSESKLTICLKMLSSIVLSPVSSPTTFTPTTGCSNSCVTVTLTSPFSGVAGSTLLEGKVAGEAS